MGCSSRGDRGHHWRNDMDDGTMSTSFTIKITVANYHFTYISVVSSDEEHIFGADAIWQWRLCSWKPDPSRDHIRNHAQNINRAEWLFNGLTKDHQNQVEAGNVIVLTYLEDEDYEFISRLWEIRNMSDAEIFKFCGGVL